MSWWTEEQDDVLREVSFRGAEFAAAEIERRCGVHHSVRAVEMRASRIHCSLAVQTVCPECGAVGVKINGRRACAAGAPRSSTWRRSGRSTSSWSGSVRTPRTRPT